MRSSSKIFEMVWKMKCVNAIIYLQLYFVYVATVLGSNVPSWHLSIHIHCIVVHNCSFR